MTVILDLLHVYTSLPNVAEMYFIGFVDPENINLDTKGILCMDTAAILKNAIFGHFLRRF